VSSPRLVAVLGYSSGAADELHAVCAARLRHAESEAADGDVVLLSGWGRRRAPSSEAVLMARAWAGRSQRVLLDSGARSTYGNVRAAVRAAQAVGASEIVLVTSGWHARRAAALLRGGLRGSGRGWRVAATSERGTAAARLRELACWALVPVQGVLASRSEYRPAS
jgi:hypothetical protein